MEEVVQGATSLQSQIQRIPRALQKSVSRLQRFKGPTLETTEVDSISCKGPTLATGDEMIHPPRFQGSPFETNVRSGRAGESSRFSGRRLAIDSVGKTKASPLTIKESPPATPTQNVHKGPTLGALNQQVTSPAPSLVASENNRGKKTQVISFVKKIVTVLTTGFVMAKKFVQPVQKKIASSALWEKLPGSFELKATAKSMHKWWLRTGRLNFFRLSALTLLAVVALTLTTFTTTKATVTELVPNADYGTMDWLNTSNAEATCDSGTHCPEVAEGSTHNTTGYISTGDSDTTGEVDEFNLTTLSNVDTVTSVAVKIYAMSATSALGGTLDDVDISLYIGGSYQTAVTVVPAYNTWAVHTATFNGSWTQSDIDGARIQLTRNIQGSGGPKSMDDDVRIASVYASVTYSQTALLNQSSYRWFNNTDATDYVTWAQTLGGSLDDEGHAIIKDSSGNLVVVGRTASYGSGGDDILLTKYNADGVEQWSKTWGGTSFDYGYSLIEDSSGNYIVTGVTYSHDDAVNGDLVLVKFDSSGVEQWSKTWGGSGEEKGYSVIEDSSGNFIVTGSSTYAGSFRSMALIKFNSSGVEQWSSTWGEGADNDYGYSVIEDSSGNFIVAGSTSTYGADPGVTNDVALVKFNSSGVEQWSKTWGGSSFDSAESVVEDSSGNYIVTGRTQSYGGTDKDIVLIKFNSSGVEQWSKTWGGSSDDWAFSVIEDSSGNFIVTGYSQSYGGTDSDVALIKFNSSGVEQWSKTWGGTSSDVGEAVIEDTFGNFIVIGTTASYGSGNNDILFNKYDSNGDIASCTMCSTETVTEADQTVTEADETVTESNENVTEADQTVTEADESVQTLVHAGTVGSFFHTLGDTGADTSQSVVKDSSDNYITVGSTTSWGAGTSILLTKYNSSGVEQWSEVWGSTGVDAGNSVIEDSSGNFIVTGSTSYGAGSDDIVLIKFNSSGVSQWSKTWGGSSADVGNSVIEDSSGNFIVTGSSQSYGGSDDDIVLIKFNSSGVEQWSKTWGGSSADVGNSVIEDSSGNFIVAGYSYSYGSGFNDIVLIKFNSSGVEQWSKTLGLGTNDYETALDVIEDSSGNFIVAGSRYDSDDGVDSGFLLVKFNSSGVEQWTKHWELAHGDITPYSVIEDSDGNFVVVGETIAGAGNDDIFMTKFNSSGVEQWSKTWGGASDDKGHSIIEDSSGDYIIAGFSNSYGAGSSDMVLLKTAPDSADCGGVCSLQEASETDETLTESNVTITEVNETATEVDETGAGSTVNTIENVINEVYKAPRIDVGTTIAAEDTAGTAPAEGTAFRLRLLQHVGTAALDQNGGTYKLQYAEKSGTCDTSFTGETYADVGTTGIIRYYDNTNGYDGQFLTENTNDPTHSTDTTYPQTYVEANNFSNTFSAVPLGDDAMWDFALVDDGAPAATSYCFRVVDSAGGLLDTYTVIPEITTQDVSLEQSAYRWFENADTSDGFATVLGGVGSDIGTSVIEDSSGNYVVVGYTEGYGSGSDVDLLLTKYNFLGAEQWSKTLGRSGTYDELGYSIIEDSSGDYVVVGATDGYGDFDMYLVKFNSSGVEQWTRYMGSDGIERGYSITEDSSGNYIVTGLTTSYGAGNSDMYLVKFNSSGTEQWSKTWGDTGSDQGKSVIEDSSGNFIVTGSTTSYGAGGADMYLVKFNSSGVEQWSKTWGDTGDDYGESVIEDSSGNFIVTGRTDSYGAGLDDMYLVKFNSSGVEQWSKTWGNGGNDWGYSVVEDSPDNYIVTGTTYNWGAGSTDMFLAKFNSSGIEQWSTTWGGTIGDGSNSVIKDSNGYFVATGYTYSYGYGGGDEDTLLVKFNSNGEVGNCSQCENHTVTEANQTVTEADETVTEADQGAIWSASVVSEVDRVIGTELLCSGFNSTWSTTIGGSVIDIAYSITEDSSGNFLATGYTTSYGGTDSDIILTKFNSSGVEQWSKTWGGTGSDSGNSVIEDSSGNYIVVGQTASYGGTDVDIALIKFNSSGVEQWSKTWGNTDSDVGYSVIEDSSGNYIVTGSTGSYGAGATDVALIKFNSSGVEQWSKTWGNTDSDVGNSVIEDSSGNFVVTGSTTSYGAGVADVALIKFNSSGVEQWSKTWGGSSTDYGNSVIEDSSGNFVVAGTTQSYGGTDIDIALIKFNSSGVEQWSKTWGGSSVDLANAVTEDSAGNYVVGGSTASYGGSDNDIALIKFNSSGVEQWSKTWGGSSSDAAKAVTEDSAGNYVVGGTTSSYGFASSDIALLKFNENGQIANCSQCADETVTEADETVTESDETVTESDQTVTEADETVTEADESVQQIRVNGEIGELFNTWGGVGQDYGYEVIEDSFGNFIVTGSTINYGSDVGTTADIILIKFNSSGVEQWSKTWGGVGGDSGNSVIEDSSGNFIVTGYSQSYGGSDNDIVLIKFNSSGVEQWSKTWGGSSDDQGLSVIEDSSGNFIVTGHTDSYGAGNADLVLIKFNSSGVEQWSKTWGGVGGDSGNSVIEDSSGNFIVTGYSQSYGGTDHDVALIKFNSSGVEQWSKTWGNSSLDWANSVIEDSSGNFIVTGTSLSGHTGTRDVLLIKFNSSGVEQWSKTWGDSDDDDHGNSVIEDSSGNFIVTGLTKTDWTTYSSIVLMKFDSSGVEQWTKTWGDSTTYGSGESVIEDSSGNFIVTGNIYSSYGAGSWDLVLIKSRSDLDSCGGVCSIQDATEADETVTEADETVTEADETVTEADETVTEADETVTEEVINDVHYVEVPPMDVGNPLASANTKTSTREFDSILRLRSLLHIGGKPFVAESKSLKVQYATRSGTCDTSFTGESYSDLSDASGNIQFYKQGAAGAELTTNANDPSHSGHDIVNQTYLDSGTFNTAYDVPIGDDSMFDFAITNVADTNGSSYCFRIVESDGTALDTYTVIPELKTPPRATQLLRHGRYFDAGETAEVLFWSSIDW